MAAGSESSPGLQALLASLDPGARGALAAALQQGRLSQAELAQAWRSGHGSPAELSRWLAMRLGSSAAPGAGSPGGAPVDGRAASARLAAASASRASSPTSGPTSGRLAGVDAGASAGAGAGAVGPGGVSGGAPAQVGPYAVERELARGGMGVVYLARHTQLGRRVALKLLPAGARGEEAERFKLEAQAAARLKHPNVVGVHDVGVEGSRPWLAMDLIDGQSLQARLAQGGPLPEEEAARAVEKVARAVAYAHKAGVLHRDIKPHNVLLDGEGEPFLADFGLAKDVSQGAKGVTVTGQVLGTPAYMPPEQAAGDLDLVDRRSDVYSLGATLYHALTGRAPFGGATVVNVITKVLTTDPPRPSTLRPDLDRDLETVCLHAMEREQAGRYPTAHALAEDLRRWREGAPILARPVGALERLVRRARRNRALTAGLAAVALVAVAVWVGVTVQLDRSRGAAMSARDAAAAAMADAMSARDEARLATARLDVLRRLERGAMLLSLGRHVEARANYEEARTRAAQALDQDAGAPLVAAATRGAAEAALHLGAAVPGADPQARTRACAFGPRARPGVVATVEDEAVVVRDLDRGQELLRAAVGASQGAWLAFTPDGETLVAAVLSAEGRSTEAAWDLRDGRARWRRDRVERAAHGVTIDPAGRLAAIFDGAGVTTLLDPSTGEEVRPRLRGDTRDGCEDNGAAAYAAAFAPTEVGPILAVGYSDGVVAYWNVADGEGSGRLEGMHNALVAVKALVWPPEGALVPGKLALVAGDAHGGVVVWDLRAPRVQDIVLTRLLDGEAGMVRSLALHAGPGGDALLAATTEDGSAWVWGPDVRAAGLRLRRRLHTPDSDAASCAFSADGRLLATAGPRLARLWSSGPRRFEGGGPVAFSRDGARVVVCRPRAGRFPGKPTPVAAGIVADRGFDVVEVDLTRGREEQAEVPNVYGPIDLLALDTTPDGRVVLATREHNDKVELRHQLWVWAPGAPPRTFDTAHPCAALAVTSGGAGLLLGPEVVPHTTGPRLAHVELRPLGDEVGDAAPGASFAWHVLSVVACQALEDGRFVTASLDGTVAWWRPGAERPERIVDAVTGAARPWTRPEERAPIGQVEIKAKVSALGYSPARGLLAVGFGDGMVRLWRDDGAPHDPPTLQGHEHQLLLCAFQPGGEPGGELLITASREGKARVWDVALGAVLRTIEAPGGRLEAAALSSDGRRLALASAGDVWVYELAR